MTKLKFIAALHEACPAFMRDFNSYIDFIRGVSSGDEMRSMREKNVEFKNKWPRSSQMMSWKLKFEVSPDLSNRSPKSFQEFIKGLEILNQAPDANVELDPAFAAVEVFRAWEEWAKSLPENVFEKEVGDKPRKESAISELTNDKETIKRLRQRAGEHLFSRVAMVIPIYPHTNKDDIDWDVIEQLKKHFYGQSYRPKPDRYEKIVKVFRAGQLLEEETAYKSWQEVADSVGLELSTVRYIYDKAHQLVFGFPAKKRHYGVEQEVVIPESPGDIPDDPGPKLKELLKYKNDFDEAFDPEKCHRCQRLVASSSGKYVPHDNRPDDEIFLCENCLSPSS